jgi:streptogrisin C
MRTWTGMRKWQVRGQRVVVVAGAVLAVFPGTASAFPVQSLPPWTGPSAAERAAAAEETLRARLGRAYAGSWLDGRTLRVGVTDPERADEARAIGARPRLVEHSARDLAAAKADLDRRASAAPDNVASWGVDVPTNSVVIEVVGDDAEALAFAEAARARSGAVRIERVQRAPQPYWPLIGGQRIEGPGTCSIGFNALHRVTGVRYLVTAGHCAGVGAVRGVGGAIGAYSYQSFPGDDYAAVHVTSAEAESTPYVQRASGNNVSVAGMERTPVGGAVCKSGITTGWTCGKVERFGVTVNYGEHGTVSGLTHTSICATHGDSGGSVVSNPGAGSEVQAQGLVSGGPGGQSCSGGQTGTMYFQPVDEALLHGGLVLYDIVDDPPTAVADAYSVDEDTTLTVPAPGVLGNDSDADRDPLTAAPVAGPEHGTLALEPDGSFAYTPDADFHGTDTFTYRADDGGGTTSQPVTVTITVRPVNDAPLARADA